MFRLGVEAPRSCHIKIIRSEKEDKEKDGNQIR